MILQNTKMVDIIRTPLKSKPRVLASMQPGKHSVLMSPCGRSHLGSRCLDVLMPLLMPQDRIM